MANLLNHISVLSPNSNNESRVDHNDFDGDHHESSWHKSRGHRGHGKDHHHKGHDKGHKHGC